VWTDKLQYSYSLALVAQEIILPGLPFGAVWQKRYFERPTYDNTTIFQINYKGTF